MERRLAFATVIQTFAPIPNGPVLPPLVPGVERRVAAMKPCLLLESSITLCHS